MQIYIKTGKKTDNNNNNEDSNIYFQFDIFGENE